MHSYKKKYLVKSGRHLKNYWIQRRMKLKEEKTNSPVDNTLSQKISDIIENPDRSAEDSDSISIARKRAALNPDAEPPQNLDPVAKIYIYQAQNENVSKESEKIEIKIEFTNESETAGIQPDLDLDVEYDKKTVELPNLAIDNTINETESKIKRSPRLKMKEKQNQEKILQTIQANNQKKERKRQEKDQHIEYNNQESQGDEQGMEEDQDDEVIGDFDQESNQKDQQQQEEIKKQETHKENCLEESEHLDNQNPKETIAEKHKRVRPHKSLDNITIKKLKYHEFLKENERQNKEQDTEQNEELMEQENSYNYEDIPETKRKRGRPRKYSNFIFPVVTEKRKRGRPPKPKVNNDNSVNVKRKRGRPRKLTDNYNTIAVDIPIAPIEDVESDEEYTVYISEEVTDDPIHLEIEGVINFLT